MSGEILWYSSRAAGVVGLALLTVVVVLGVVTSGRRRPRGQLATVTMAVHRWLGLGVLVFLAAHVVTAVVDGYVDISALAVVAPFTSSYSTVSVAMGTVALDLLLAVVVTSSLRHRMPERSWRFVHGFGYGVWPLAVLHGLLLGTSDEPALRLATLACGAAGAAAVAWRVSATHPDRQRRVAIAAQEWR